MTRKNSTKRTAINRRTDRLPRSHFATGRELKQFFGSLYGPNKDTLEESTMRLMEMAVWMINYTPEGGQLAQDIYLAIGRAWQATRKVYGSDAEGPAEREIRRMHAELLAEFERDRKGPTNKRQKTQSAPSDSVFTALEEQLDAIALLPENESARFQLQSEIHKATNRLGEDEWPDVIDG